MSTQLAAASTSPEGVDQDQQRSTSRPLNDRRNKSYSSTTHSRGRRSTINSGEALDLATGGASLRRPAKLQSSLSSPHSGFIRASGPRSFLLPTTSSGISGHTGNGPSNSAAGGVNKLASTMAPLSKPKRTSKTSQKLVVLPSGPQTKPLADDGEEASDDAALPTVALNRPPRRAPTTRRPAPEQLRALKHERARTTEEEKPHDGEATKRVREYKSEAERMTKEERKKAGHKRITAYCVAEGLKMKQLTGFLKREHNVTPRVFDEAVYVVYQLPLLPGYGPNINVRSSAHTGPETDKPGKSQLLSTLQEAEEDGYNDTYFPQPVPGLEEPPRLQRSHSSSHMVSESEPIPVEPMPGLVHAASVEEVRGGDGYMTSGSFPDHSAMPEHLERGYGAYGSFQPSYDPYPSSLESSPVTLRDTHIPERYSEAQVADVVFPTPFLQRAESSDAEPQTPGMDSGVETDDPGAYTDPGVYGEYPWDPKSTLARNDSQDTEVSQSENDMAKSARTEYTNKTIQRLQEGSSGSDVTTKGAAGQTTNETSVNVVETNPAATASELSLASETFGPISAYREQLDHEHERQVVQDAQAEYEEQREERRKLEYERALERERQRERERELDNIGEVVFFDYGVIVFFGLDERGERDVLEDISKAGGMKRSIKEDEWEIEECHFTHDSQITYPRIYNDFFTLKSRSHLLKLSIAHALAQSTLLARYESLAGHTLTSPIALSIPRQMAESGSLQLRRNEALKLTGRLFKLRRDVNLVSNVLDVPELFWDEASLKELYDAVRDYMEIDPRVENLNEKLVVASDFLDAIHEHLNENAMEKITRIVIWLIVVAVLVEFGEIVARLVMHSALSNRPVPERSLGILANFAARFRGAGAASQAVITSNQSIHDLTREQALEVLERMMGQVSS